MATPLNFVLEQVWTLFKSTWPTKISTKCRTARYCSECFSLLWSCPLFCDLSAFEEYSHWLEWHCGKCVVEEFSLEGQCWTSAYAPSSGWHSLLQGFFSCLPTLQPLTLLRVSPSLYCAFKNSRSQRGEKMKQSRQWFQECLSCCKQLSGVALWGRWPSLIRAGDNNELVCSELITDSRLFSFPIHECQVIVNGQWQLLVIIMFA